MVPFQTFIHVAKLPVSLYFSNKRHQAHLAFLSLPCTDQGWKNGCAVLYFFCHSAEKAQKLWASKHWGKSSIHLFGWSFLLVLFLKLFFVCLFLVCFVGWFCFYFILFCSFTGFFVVFCCCYGGGGFLGFFCKEPCFGLFCCAFFVDFTWFFTTCLTYSSGLSRGCLKQRWKPVQSRKFSHVQ